MALSPLPWSRTAACGLALLAAELGHARSASAQVDHVPLTWNAPASCPSAEAVLADVERNLAESGDPHAPFLAVANVLGSKGGQWQATLRVEARGGYVDRRFAAESCEAIASAAALIIALSAESGGGGSAAAPPPPPPPSPPAAPSVTVSRSAGLSPFSISVAEIVDVMTMPGSSLGFEITGAGSWAASDWHARLMAGAAFFPYHSVSDYDLQGVFRMGVVSGRGCLSGDLPSSLRVGLCVGAELAAIHSSGTGEDYTHSVETTTKPVLSPVGSVLLSWNMTRQMAFFARADLAVNALHPDFNPFSAASGPLFTVPIVSARGALGIELGL